MSSEPVFLTQERLAARWGVTPRSIARRRAEGLIPPAEVYFGLRPAWSLETVAKVEEELRRRAIEHPPKFSSTRPALEARAQKVAARGRKERAPKGGKPKAVKPVRKQMRRRGA